MGRGGIVPRKEEVNLLCHGKRRRTTAFSQLWNPVRGHNVTFNKTPWNTAWKKAAETPSSEGSVVSRNVVGTITEGARKILPHTSQGRIS